MSGADFLLAGNVVEFHPRAVAAADNALGPQDLAVSTGVQLRENPADLRLGIGPGCLPAPGGEDLIGVVVMVVAGAVRIAALAMLMVMVMLMLLMIVVVVMLVLLMIVVVVMLVLLMIVVMMVLVLLVIMVMMMRTAMTTITQRSIITIMSTAGCRRFLRLSAAAV